MPELPEVETVCRGLSGAITGQTIGSARMLRADLRMPFPKDLPQKLKNRQITAISRRAKYLLWHLDNDDVILAHLGMTGRFIVNSKPAKLAKHDHLELRLKDGRQVIYNDPRRFGLVDITSQANLPQHKLLRHLGPEPLDKGFNADYLKNALSSRKAPIKGVLMDQAIVVGVGNIYASEALFLSGIHPLKPAAEAAPKASLMVKNIRKVLQDAIASGGSSLRDFVDISGDTGYFQHHFKVYGREKKPCESCKTPILNLNIAGRSSFFCPSCQP